MPPPRGLSLGGNMSLLLAALVLVAAIVPSSVLMPVAGGNWSPISTAPPPFPTTTHPLPPTSYWSRSLSAPYPTNEWWQNLVLDPSNQPVTISPLAMRIETTDTKKLHSMGPYNRTSEYEYCYSDRQGTHCPGWRRHGDLNALPLPGKSTKRGCDFGLAPKQSTADIVSTFFQPGFTMSAVEVLAPHQVTKYDQLSVTLQFAEQGSRLRGGGRIEFPLVRGMPYATAVYTQLTPYLFTINAILKLNDQDLPGTVTANKLRLKLNNEQVVLVYVWNTNHVGDHDVQAQWQWDRNTLHLIGPHAKGDWVVRLAFLLPAQQGSPDAEKGLDDSAKMYPIGGKFDYEFVGSMRTHEKVGASEQVTTMIEYQVGSSGDQAALLMMSLAHHQATLVHPQYVTAVTVDTLLGPMIGVRGNKWTMAIDAVPSAFKSFRTPREVDPARADAIRMQLIQDMQSAATAGEPDPYGFGKSLSKLGRMALIGEELEADAQDIGDLVAKMKDLVAPWLQSTNPNQLLHDSSWGGIVSLNGIKDAAADFGQGYYNDHHFHYGYIVYGCAVIAHFDPTWASTYRENILALVRDYANPSADDTFFPVLRHFSPFDGHSWAAGLFVFADGRNQESSSESINGYYAMMLLGEALHMDSLAQQGRMLASMEILGANTYWHSTSAYSVYPEELAKNKCIGMKWSDKVVEATWFAAGMTYIHGINMLPFTPASELYLPAPWVAEEYPFVIATVTSDITDEWRGFLYGTHCVIDPNAAWTEIAALTSFDGGNTRSNLMYFCATRPKTNERLRPHHEEHNSTTRLRDGHRSIRVEVAISLE